MNLKDRTPEKRGEIKVEIIKTKTEKVKYLLKSRALLI